MHPVQQSKHTPSIRQQAHGLWALTPLNRANAPPGRVEGEQGLYKQAVEAVEAQIYSLGRHPKVPFLVEGRAQSGLWGLGVITQAITRNPDWKIVRVNRCAYGRLEQKGTKFLTNVGWQPVGRTRGGRCGKGCTGTQTDAGKTKHQCQTMANSSDDTSDWETKSTTPGTSWRGAQ